MYPKRTTLALSCLALVAILGSQTSHANVVSFGPAQTYTPFGGEPTSVAVGDLNGDGKADMVVTAGIGGSGNQGEVTVFLGKGNGTFTHFTGFDSGAGFPTSVIIADLNRDGKPDLIVLNCDDGSKPPGTCSDGTHSFLAIFRGNGNGTFQSPQTYDLGGAGEMALGLLPPT